MSVHAPENGSVLLEQRQGVAVLTMNRPDVLNTLTLETLDQLADMLVRLNRQRDVYAIILTGSSGVFAAGADIRQVSSLNGLSAVPFARRGQQVCRLLERSPMLTIAAVDGYCMGGGLDLALACHIRIATRQSVFAHPGVRLGIITGFGGTQRLPRVMGRAQAMELLMTGRRLTAQDAYRLGLVNRLVQDGSVVQASLVLAQQWIMSTKAPRSLDPASG